MVRPIKNDFDYPAQPGGEWQPMAGAPEGMAGPSGGSTAPSRRSDLMQTAEPRYGRWMLAGYWMVSMADTSSWLVGGAGASADVVYALPFPSGAGFELYGFGMYVNVAGPGDSYARLGVYRSVSPTDMYPGSLIWSSGNISLSTTGTKSFSPGLHLSPQSIYWAACLFNASAVGQGSVLELSSATGAATSLGYIDMQVGRVAGRGVQGAWTWASSPPLPTQYPWPGGTTVGVPGGRSWMFYQYKTVAAAAPAEGGDGGYGHNG